MRTIALEEHYATPAFINGPGRWFKDLTLTTGNAELIEQLPHLIQRLCDLDHQRVTDMDTAGIDLQVLSLTAPGVEQLTPPDATTLARETNDHLAEAVRRHPTRLAGFAALPTPAPDIAADELQRSIHAHGFKGAVINGHTRGDYLDDPYFWPILEAAEALDVPLYLHPTPPLQTLVDTAYAGNYPPEVAAALATTAWGWHIDTATHILRLVVSGALDRFPRLQLIIGHMGEALPFMLPRIEHALSHIATLDRPIGAYFRDNLHYTFAGFNWTPTFLTLLLQVGADRIMFSTDYPYGSMTQARAFLDHLPVSPTDKHRIAHHNAETLLHL